MFRFLSGPAVIQFLWLDRETGTIRESIEATKLGSAPISAIVTIIHNTRLDTSSKVIVVIIDARRYGNGSMKRRCGKDFRNSRNHNDSQSDSEWAAVCER
jgi:hypothetical protein